MCAHKSILENRLKVESDLIVVGGIPSYVLSQQFRLAAGCFISGFVAGSRKSGVG